MKKWLLFAWHSPTLTTWSSFFTRSFSVVLMGLLLKTFPPEETALWFKFSIVLGLQLVIDGGLATHFSRLIAQAKAGAQAFSHTLQKPLTHTNQVAPLPPNWDMVEKIYQMMQWVYWRLNAVFSSLLVVAGSAYLYRDIAALANPLHGWLAWGTVCLTSLAYFQANKYNAYLQGLNHVALLRRWETLSSVGGLLSSFLVIGLGGGLLALTLVGQSWVLFNLYRNYRLSLYVEEGLLRSFKPQSLDQSLWNYVKHISWRTGLGTLLSFGTMQCAVLAFTYDAETAWKASFLLAVRLAAMVAEFAQAPFYSKIPRLSSLYTQGDWGVHIGVAKQGIRRAHWLLVMGFIGIGFTAPDLLRWLGSQTAFPDLRFWALLGLAYFFYRMGAMYLQWYSMSNHIVWHIAAGIAATGFGLAVLLFAPHWGILAFPLTFLVGQLLFAAYCTRCVHRLFDASAFSFEKNLAIPPFLLILAYAVFEITIRPLWW
jgi:hypothetical protein